MSEEHHVTNTGTSDARLVNPEEERKRLKGFIDEAQQLQQLLRTYAQQQRTLEADVSAFVVKEIKEQQTMKELRDEIHRRECGSLQNMAYVRFTKDHKEASIGFEQTAPTQRMRDRVTSGSSSEEPRTGGTGSLAYTSLTALKASNSAVSSWCPNVVVDLRAYGDLKEVLLGWRAPTSSTATEVDALGRDVFCEPNTATNPTALCCFANGILCVPPSVLDAHGAPTAALADAVTACATRTVPTCTADVATKFVDWLHGVSSFSAQTFATAAQASTEAQGSAHASFLASGLVGDIQDTLTFVDPARLANTQLFRAFVLHGEVTAIEHVGAPVDVLPTLVISANGDRTELRRWEQLRLTRTAACLYAELVRYTEASSVPTNVVLTLAVAPESLDESSTHTRGVLVDVCRLTPSVPFRWHLTWGEVCALGQMQRGVSRTGTDAKDEAPHAALKCSRVQAASLEPYDAVSAAYFPMLNKELLGRTIDAPALVDDELGCAPKRTDTRNASALFAGGAAVSAAVVIGAVLLRLWANKQR